MTKRKVKEIISPQGRDEEIPYQITTTPWGSTPSDVTCTLWDVTDDDNWDDVSDTLLEGDASISGDVITAPVVKSLVPKHQYRLEVKFTTGGIVFECYAEINGEK